MSIPMIFFFWGIALFNPSLPHWSGPGFVPLFFVAGIYLSTKQAGIYPKFIKISGGLIVFIIIAGVGLARFAPFNVGGSSNFENYGERSLTLDICGWEKFGNDFKLLEEHDVATGLMKKDAPILIGNWFPAGHLLFYVARLTGQPVIGIGKLTEIHKFAWLNKSMPPIRLGDDSYVIVPSNAPLNVSKEYNMYYSVIMPPTIINQEKGGKMVRYFKIYRLHDCKQIPPSIL